MPSRKLAQLVPIAGRAAMAHDALLLAEGIELVTTRAFRSMEEQAMLYRIGRTRPGRVVTNAPPGGSFHQYRVARDVAPVIGGKVLWDDDALWERIGETGEALGFEWGGRFKNFRDAPHFQLTAGMSLGEMAALAPEEINARIEDWYERTGLIKTIEVAESGTALTRPVSRTLTKARPPRAV